MGNLSDHQYDRVGGIGRPAETKTLQTDGRTLPLMEVDQIDLVLENSSRLSLPVF